MVGVIATSTAMALRLNGISHWVMWEMTSLYEQVGTLQDGLNTLSMHQEIKDEKNAKDLQIKKASVSFQNIVFNYPAQKKSVIHNFSLQYQARRKSWISWKIRLRKIYARKFIIEILRS